MPFLKLVFFFRVFFYADSALNSLPDDKLKEFADDHFKFDENGSKLSKRVENTVGKGEIAPFPTVFSKGLFPRGVKRCHCVGMG